MGWYNVLSVSLLQIICQFIYPFETRHKINIDPFQAPLMVIIDPLFDMKVYNSNVCLQSY